MGTLLKNAVLWDLDPVSVRNGSLAVDAGRFVEVPAEVPTDWDIVDCSGKLLLPGLVVGHTHLYSALAVGMPPPSRQPSNFVQILEEVWWKLDRALDDEAVFMSALVGAAQAALSGATCLVDHHASPYAIAGSLDRVQQALEMIGIRGVLCYEVTDRNGEDGAAAGLEENDRYLTRSARAAAHNPHHVPQFAGLVGAHASFTLGDHSMKELAELAEKHGTGVHIHVAEDPADEQHCLATYGISLLDRLDKFGMLEEQTVLAHCTHLPEKAIARIRRAACWMAHNTRSNMNNSVGYAKIAEMDQGKLALGTDGIDEDMFAESQTAWFKLRDARVELEFGAPLKWIGGSARLASHCLGASLGKLQPGCAADLVVLDYPGHTPLYDGNAMGHWFFGTKARMVQDVMRGGQWIVKDRQLTSHQAREALKAAPAVATAVWKRFQQL